MHPIVPTLHILSQSVEDLSTPHPAHDPGRRAGTPWDTTHLFTSTVVRVKGTPLSSSTTKSRWQNGSAPHSPHPHLPVGTERELSCLFRPGMASLQPPQRIRGEDNRTHTPAQPGKLCCSPCRCMCCYARQGASSWPLPAPRASVPHLREATWHSRCWPWHP